MNQLIEQLKQCEGFRGKAYHDTKGVLTIGYGYNLDENPLHLLPDYVDNLKHSGIDQSNAEKMLIACVNNAIHELEQNFPWWSRLCKSRQDVLTNMCFNLGISRLKQFDKTLSCCEHGFYANAAEEMLKSQWAKQVGHRSIMLSEQMRTGKYHE